MVRANFKQNSLLESLDNLFENGGNIYIKPPFNKYYRVSDPAEIADLEGMDVIEFESFEAEDPVRQYVNVVGYAIAKDEYRDQIEEASGLLYAEIGEDGKLYYNVGERVFEVETDDIGINYDEMGREVESEVVKSPSKSLKENDEFEKLVDDIYEFFSEWDPYSVDKADYDLDRDSIKLALSTPDKDDKVLYDVKEIASELEDGDPLKDKANSIIDRLTFTENEDLNEIGPVAAGLIGAAGGAIVGSLATSALNKNKEESAELEEDQSKDNEPAKYKVSFYPYDRYGSDEGLKNASFGAKTLKDALKKLASRLGLYLEPEDIDEEYSDAREALESIKDSNGDGCDYIVLFKNETTGEVYIEEDYKPEDLDWDDDYDESEKPKSKKSLKELDSKDNTSTIYIDLSEIISYAEAYINKELRMAGGSNVKITTTEDGQYMITLNRSDNSIKAYCDLGSRNAEGILDEGRTEIGYTKGGYRKDQIIMDYIYDILSNHNDEMPFEQGCNLDLVDQNGANKIYIEDNSDESVFVLSIAGDDRSKQRKFATANQDELEDEYKGIYGSDWSHWDEFIDSKMSESENLNKHKGAWHKSK